MGTFLTILIILACVLLVFIILVQNPRGGGLAAEFSSNNQFMGVRKTADFLEKSTWTLGVVLVFLTLIATAVKESTVVANQSEIQEKIEDLQEPIQTVPQNPQNIPVPANPTQ